MAKCADGCTCGRHKGPWTGKTRPGLRGAKPALKHGHTWKDPVTGEARVSPTYKSWQAMKHRCRKRPDYAGRGIEVCPHWLVFENFLADMGERPSLDYSIERKDNDGGYWCGHCEWCVANSRPPNCEWATRSKQQRNKRPPTEEFREKMRAINGKKAV